MFSHMVVLGIALCSVFIGQVSFREQFIVLGWNFVHGPYNIYIYIYIYIEREREREREREVQVTPGVTLQKLHLF